MKKEKTIRTYQRRTKTGKVVTVKQHTAKYDAAEALKEAAKKKGAGDELEKLKKKSVDKPTEEEVAEFEKLLDSFPEELDERERKMRLKQFMKAKGKEGRQAEIDETKWEIKEEKKARKVWKANEKFGKRLEKSYEKEHKKSDTSYGFTADEYKAWYHWDQDADPKNKSALKVEKALKAKMGAKGYKKYFDEMSDSYSSRGHNKAYKALDAEATVPKKDAKTPKEPSKIATPNSIEEIAKAGLKRVSVHYGKGDKKSATYYTDGKQVYEPGEDGYLKKITKNKMVPEARKLIDPPKSRASHKENSMGFSSLDWEATYGGGATGVDSDAAMRKIDKAARKYLGAKAYNKWAKYQDDSDDTGGSYKGFIKQLKRFKEGKDDWKSAPKNSGKYLAGKQKAGAEKEGLDVTRYKDGFSAGGTKEQWKSFLRAKKGKPYPKLDADTDKKILSEIGDAKRARASMKGLKDPKRDAAAKEMKRKDHEYLKEVAKKAMFKNDPWFKRNGWTKQEKRNGNYSWISPDGNVSVPVTKLGMGAGKNFGTPKIKRSKE